MVFKAFLRKFGVDCTQLGQSFVGENMRRDIKILIVDGNVAVHRSFQDMLSGVELSLDFVSDVSEDVRQKFIFVSAFSFEEGMSLLKEAKECEEPYCMAFFNPREKNAVINPTAALYEIWEVDPEVNIVLLVDDQEIAALELGEHLDLSDQLIILRAPYNKLDTRQIASVLAKKWELIHALRLQKHLDEA